MNIEKKKKLFLEKIIFYCIVIFPIGFIAGPLATDLLVSIIALVFLYLHIIEKKFFYVRNLTYFIFGISLFFLIVHIFNYEINNQFYKSISYIRFLILPIACICIFDNSSKIYILLKSIFFSTIFVCLDIIFQKFFGYDLFGFNALESYVKGMHFKNTNLETMNVNRYSGPFGDELIAGGYISKFLLINLFYLFFLKNEKKTYFFLFFIITFLCLLLAGERVSLFYGISLYLVILLCWVKNLKRKIYLLILLILFFIITFNNKNIYERFILNTSNELGIFSQSSNVKFMERAKSIRQISHLNSGLEIFKKNILFGNGFKSYRVLCDKNKFQCSTHPHNFIVEILVETGLIGLILLVVYFLILVRKVSISSNNDYVNKTFYFWILFTFIPLYPTGSFFNNHYASQIWFCFSIILILIKNKDYLIFDLKK